MGYVDVAGVRHTLADVAFRVGEGACAAPFDGRARADARTVAGDLGVMNVAVVAPQALTPLLASLW